MGEIERDDDGYRCAVDPSTAHLACPKSMTFGPCGGVGADGSCEAMPDHCVFLDAAPGPSEAPRAPVGAGTGAAIGATPTVLIDLRPDIDDTSSLWRASEALHRSLDGIASPSGADSEQPHWAVLAGDHLDDPDDRSPAQVAAAVVDAGLDCIVTVTGRRPHREAVDEAVAVHRAGASAVLCVTGDHPAARSLARRVEFGTESMRIVSDASALGVPAVVAESPASPPAGRRAERVLAKQRAGASACVLNHAGSVEDLESFARAVRRRGARLPLVAPVPLITDADSARRLDQFPGLVLPPGFTADVLAAADPRARGIEAAVELAGRFLDGGAFAGVNLSGMATGAGLVAHAEIAAEVARRVLHR